MKRSKTEPMWKSELDAFLDMEHMEEDNPDHQNADSDEVIALYTDPVFSFIDERTDDGLRFSPLTRSVVDNMGDGNKLILLADILEHGLAFSKPKEKMEKIEEYAHAGHILGHTRNIHCGPCDLVTSYESVKIGVSKYSCAICKFEYGMSLYWNATDNDPDLQEKYVEAAKLWHSLPEEIPMISEKFTFIMEYARHTLTPLGYWRPSNHKWVNRSERWDISVSMLATLLIHTRKETRFSQVPKDVVMIILSYICTENVQAAK